MSSTVTMTTMAVTNCNEKDHDLSSPPSPDEATDASSNSGSSESKNETNSYNNSSSSSLFDRYTSNLPWVVDSLQGCEENLMTILVDGNKQQRINIPRISESDLSISNLLGQGGFCNVLRVYYDDENDVTGEFISKEYAMKCLNPNKFLLSSSPPSEENDGEKPQEEDEEEEAKADAFVLAASDLAMEVCILSMLNHNNIIRLTGITKAGFCQSFRSSSSSSVGNNNKYGFFFLMDVLKPQSLFDLLTKWRKYKESRKGLVRKLRRTLSNRSSSQQVSSRGESTRRQQQQQSTMNFHYLSPIEAMRILAGSNAGCEASSYSSRRRRRLSPSGGSSIASNDDVQSQFSQSCRSTHSHTSQQSQLSQSYRSTASSISSCDTSSQFDDENDDNNNNNNHRMFESDKPPCLKDRFDLIVKGVINGLTYLHSQGIVFRDLKPSNIGFDARDCQVKLFDFGLARRTCDCKSNEIAGSYRYMSPEMIAKASNDDNEDVSTTTTTTTTKDDLLKAMDVYSLSVLLWEVATLQRPYSLFLDAGGRPSDSFMKTVVQEGWRHSLSDIIYEPLGRLIQESWNPVPSTRPTMAQIQAIIELPDFDIPNKDAERRHRRRGGGRGRGIINYRRGVTARRRRSSEDGATTKMDNNCSNDRVHPPAGGFSQYKPSRHRFLRSRSDGDAAEILNCSTHSSPAFIIATESKFRESPQNNIFQISSSDTRTTMPPKSDLTLTDDVEEDGGGGFDQEYNVPLKGL